MKKSNEGVVVLSYSEKAQETNNQRNLSVRNTPSLES